MSAEAPDWINLRNGIVVGFSGPYAPDGRYVRVGELPKLKPLSWDEDFPGYKRDIAAAYADLLEQREAGVTDAWIGALARVFGSGYQSGHEDTVESRFTDVTYSDCAEYWTDQIREILEEDSELCAALLAVWPATAEPKPTLSEFVRMPAADRAAIGRKVAERVDEMQAHPADSGRAGDASAEDRFEQYVKTLIDHAPDVQKLGERLAHLLDDDQFNNIEPTLLGIAAALAAQGQGEPVAWLRNDAAIARPDLHVITTAVRDLWIKVNAQHVERYTIPLYTAPPASPTGVPKLTLGQRAVAAELLRCFTAWEPGVRVMGNVQARDAADLLRSVLTAAPSAPKGDGGVE